MRAGFDSSGLLWLIVVVASIIGQIIKSSKKHIDAAPGSPSAPRPDRPAGGDEPARELEDFLRNLMGEQIPRSEAPPRAAPSPETAPQHKPATPRPVTAMPAVPASRPEQRSYVPVPAVPPPRPAPVRVAPKATVPRSAPPPIAVAAPVTAQLTRPIAAYHDKALAALMADVQRQIKTRESLRAALLLREILGPPIGLRDIQTKFM